MLEELQRRNYTSDTIRGYILAVEQFGHYFDKSPELMGAEESGQFQLHLLREKKLALGTIALRMGAPRFLYKKALKRRDQAPGVAVPDPQGTHRTREADLRQNGVERVS